MVCVGVIWTETWGEHDPLKVHLQAQGTDDVWIRSPPAARASEAAVCSGGRAGGGASLPGQRIRVAPAAKRPAAGSSPRPRSRHERAAQGLWCSPRPALDWTRGPKGAQGQDLKGGQTPG